MTATPGERTRFSDWHPDDRPREKMITKGPGSLSDTELIAILLGSGSARNSAIDLARILLNKASNNLNHLGKLSVPDLMKFHGIGSAKAVTIVAAMEL